MCLAPKPFASWILQYFFFHVEPSARLRIFVLAAVEASEGTVLFSPPESSKIEGPLLSKICHRPYVFLSFLLAGLVFLRQIGP